MMGQSWPLNMYSPAHASQIKSNDRTRLVFTPQLITEELKAEMMMEKQKAIYSAKEAAALWKTLEGRIDSVLYDEILKLLKGNIDDAVLWHMGFDMYMDMKLGTLTEEKIDAVLKECREKGLKGTIVDNPLDPKPVQTDCCHTPSSLKVFAEQLRSEIRNPWLERAALQTEGEDTFSIQYGIVPVDE